MFHGYFARKDEQVQGKIALAYGNYLFVKDISGARRETVKLDEMYEEEGNDVVGTEDKDVPGMRKYFIFSGNLELVSPNAFISEPSFTLLFIK